jgi:hypothetical protein
LLCFTVKSDRLEEYKQRHRAMGTEMLVTLRETGWNIKHRDVVLENEGCYFSRMSRNNLFSKIRAYVRCPHAVCFALGVLQSFSAKCQESDGFFRDVES